MNPASWRRPVTISLIGLIVAGLVGVLFAQWLQAGGDWRTGLSWERALLLSIDRTVPTFFDLVMLSLPWIGTNMTLLPILALVSLWLWRRKGRGELALELMVVVLGSLILNAVLKDLFDRPRPELWEHRGQFKWAAYPSGHAIVGVAVYFTMCNMLHRERGWVWPYFVATGLLMVNLYSRLYLGVHWPSDVLGGLLLGIVWLGAVSYAFAPFHDRDLESSPVRSVGSDSRGSDPSIARRVADTDSREPAGRQVALWCLRWSHSAAVSVGPANDRLRLIGNHPSPVPVDSRSALLARTLPQPCSSRSPTTSRRPRSRRSISTTTAASS